MNEKAMTLGSDYDGRPVRGFFVTEKLDGCRAYWDGAQLWTRGGHVIPAPAWFTAGLPKGFALDGEIFAGRGRLQTARLAVQHGRFTPECTFAVFDAPEVAGAYPVRLAAARRRLPRRAPVPVVKCRAIESKRQLRAMLADILSAGGEGLMLRNPEVTRYEQGRTSNLLKLKSSAHL